MPVFVLIRLNRLRQRLRVSNNIIDIAKHEPRTLIDDKRSLPILAALANDDAAYHNHRFDLHAPSVLIQTVQDLPVDNSFDCTDAVRELDLGSS